jgi:hypothetical protein
MDECRGFVNTTSKGRKSKGSNLLALAILVLSAATIEAQRRPPEIGRHLPDPGPNRVEVRFALGEKAVECKYFRLTAKVEGHVVMAGKFASGFQIPPDALTLPRNDALELEFKCGNHRWHFTQVGERAFLPGWWWVGTDYPPFQETFQGWPELKDAIWVRYLLVSPTVESGFTVYKFCPAKIKDQKPGPCYDD